MLYIWSHSTTSHLCLEPVEFPSYGSGSVKVQALQAEMDKMLEKATLEVDLPDLGYHSCLLLVQKATEG